MSVTWRSCRTCSTSRQLPNSTRSRGAWTVPRRPQAKFEEKKSSSEREKCGGCHAPPFYLDHLLHDLQVERFLKDEPGDGPIKTFTLRGIKDSPPYLHDGRLFTLEDTVEFFNIVLQLKLRPKKSRIWSHSCDSCERREREACKRQLRRMVACGSRSVFVS